MVDYIVVIFIWVDLYIELMLKNQVNIISVKREGERKGE